MPSNSSHTKRKRQQRRTKMGKVRKRQLKANGSTPSLPLVRGTVRPHEVRMTAAQQAVDDAL